MWEFMDILQFRRIFATILISYVIISNFIGGVFSGARRLYSIYRLKGYNKNFVHYYDRE